MNDKPRIIPSEQLYRILVILMDMTTLTDYRITGDNLNNTCRKYYEAHNPYCIYYMRDDYASPHMWIA